MALKQRHVTLKEIQALTGKQWSCLRIAVTCTLEDARTTRWAAQFYTVWSLEIKDSGRSLKRELQQSLRESTSETRVFVASTKR